MKNIAIIPARGGSKRIPRKNITPFMGKPIIAYSIEAALQSGLFEEVMVSTDDEEIAGIACKYGAKVPFMRSAEMSNEYAGTDDVILEVLRKYKEQGREFETVCCIYSTAPFVTPERLREAYGKMNSEIDSVFTCVAYSYPIQRSLHIVDGKISMVYPEYKNARSQDLEPIYHDAGQFYFSRTAPFVESRTFWGENWDGKTMGTYEISDLDEREISRLMVGRDVSLDIEKEEMEFGKTVFSVKDLVYVDQFGKTRLDHVSFSIKEGQILGIAGIDGNGQSELGEAIVGTLKQQQGTITMNGKDISNAPVLARQEAGISHVSEDRMKFGTAPKLSLEDNTISKVYYTDKLKTHGLLDSKKISEFTNRILKEFLVKYDNSKQSIAELSGGNVQKVVVGREFDYEPDLLIMNQPTRGIDVGAIEFIRKKIVDMRSRKKAILLVSADLSEILSLSDTILVMHEGRIVGHIADVKKTSENELGLYMLGVKEDSKEQIGGACCE